MKKVALLAIIFLPVLMFVSTMNIGSGSNGSLFEHSAAIGNKVIESIQEMSGKISDWGEKINRWLPVAGGGMSFLKWGTVGPDMTLTSDEMWEAYKWEYKNGKISWMKYHWHRLIWSWYTNGFNSITEFEQKLGIKFSPNNPIIYPPEEE